MAKSDVVRFDEVWAAFRARLGLPLIPLALDRRNDDGDGWHALAAGWRERGVNVAVWYDKWLGKGDRHFWFGFEGPKDRVRKLRDACDLDVPGVYDDGGFPGSRRRLAEDNGGFVHENYGRGRHYLGWYDVGFTDPDNPVREAANLVQSLVRCVEQADDVAELRRRKDLDETTRRQLIQARRGQGVFRRKLEKAWGGRCAVTGIGVPEVLRASHIRRWADADKTERLDASNGLLLCVTLDALFDKHLISFGDDGKMLVSPSLAAEECGLLDLNDKRLSKAPSSKQREYLREHRRVLETSG